MQVAGTKEAKLDLKIVCPCCPLHCDDLTGAELSSSPERCPVAFNRLRSVLDEKPTSTAKIDQQAVMLRCVDAIRSSRRTAITGRVLDLATARAVVRFSEQTGAEIQVTGPNRSSQSVMKRDGGYTCTLGELTRPTSSLLIIGDVEVAWPRISRHLTEVKELAQLPDSPALLDQIAVLRRAAASNMLEPLPQSLDRPTLRQAIELIQRASYLAILVAPLREDPVHSPLIWSSINGLVQEINRQRRAAVVTLDETYTLRSTMASRMEKVPQATASIEPTLQMHLSPFGEASSLQSQAVIHVGLLPAGSSSQLHLRAATPGINAPGVVYRGDGSVALPLIAWKFSDPLPTPAEWLNQMLALV